MDGKKDLPPALFRTWFLEHYCTRSEAIPVFTDGSKSDAGTFNPTVMTACCRSPCGTCWSSDLVLLIYDTASSTGVAVEIVVSIVSLRSLDHHACFLAMMFLGTWGKLAFSPSCEFYFIVLCVF
ncbi:hypothetical protein E2C01_040453 [Portunus trituberculatus]|uniref:Uncharacterized protein n=1 Tax=Portunus trituberculatus TaxID=210409 RepID=A0A5B7FN18_PORTR|nr:hypothetical protein [Portunus trituberculatus]